MREDWVECSIGDVFDVVTGNTPPKANPLLYGGDIPFIKPPEINNGEVESSSEFLTKDGARYARILPKQSVLITCIGNLGRVAINSNFEIAFNQQINALKPNRYVYSKYIFYNAQSSTFRNQLEELSTAVTVSLVNKTNFSQIKFSLPPLPEQRAIVKKLESLFSSLDAGVADLKKAQQQLKIYRQAVLKKAFEGELSKQLLGKVSVVKRGKSKHRPRNDDRLFGGIYPFIQTGEIRKANGGIVKEYENTYSEFGLAQSKIWPKGTLCLTIAANIGETAFLGFDACFPDSVVGITSDENVLNLNYLNYYIQLTKQEIDRVASATAQKNINVDFLENLEIPVPRSKKQSQIVKEIESRLSVCDSIEQSIKESLTKAEALRQSILKKAFEGKLLTEQELAECRQAADYEPASVLLERIKAEQKGAIPDKKRALDRKNVNLLID